MLPKNTDFLFLLDQAGQHKTVYRMTGADPTEEWPPGQPALFRIRHSAKSADPRDRVSSAIQFLSGKLKCELKLKP